MDDFSDKYRKKNPFSVPDGYFDNLTERIVKQVKKQEKAEKNSSPLRKVRPYMGVAAGFLLALFVLQILFWGIQDYSQKERQENSQLVVEMEEEDIFDSHFNPTTEEIIEYLVAESDNYDLILATIN